MHQSDFVFDSQNLSPTFPHLAHSFYDSDSEGLFKVTPQQTSVLTFSDVIEIIENNFDLRVTHIHDITEYLRENVRLPPGMSMMELQRKIKKRKISLKRAHAKGLKNLPVRSTETVLKKADLKKERNRQSAQLARERKREKIQTLEQQNSQLLQESNKVKEENERLRKQLADFNRFEEIRLNPLRKSSNKIFSLIIMLGVLFMFSVCKVSRPEKSINFNFEGAFERKELFDLHEEQNFYLKSSQQALIDLEREENFLGSKERLDEVLDSLRKYVTENGGKNGTQIEIPAQLRSQLEELKVSLL